ncbi:MAG: dTDP-4-dehydrorhamnose reductase [bacterium]
MPKKILVTGKNGQLGQSIYKIHQNYPQFEFTFVDRQVLDFSKPENFGEYFKHNKFDFCINCAAYTKVDQAEAEQELALKVNAEAVGALALELAKQEADLIHISTDYVFNGHSYKPYLETDTTDPINFYGQSKLEGEKLALAMNEKSFILRTSWVWSEFGNNFVKTMVKLGQTKETLNVVVDQIGTPTYAGDLAEAVLKLIANPILISEVDPDQSVSELLQNSRIFNYSNEGVCSWYDFATEIMALKGLNCQVNPIPANDYPTPAQRPFYSVLSKQKIKQNFDLQIPHWRTSLIKIIELL